MYTLVGVCYSLNLAKYIYMYTHMYTYMCIYIYTHTVTHILISGTERILYFLIWPRYTKSIDIGLLLETVIFRKERELVRNKGGVDVSLWQSKPGSALPVFQF